MTHTPSDPVLAPAHYTRLNPEPLDVAEAWNLPHHLASVLKYIARAGHKNLINRQPLEAEIEDLDKASNYLCRYLDLLHKRRQERMTDEDMDVPF